MGKSLRISNKGKSLAPFCHSLYRHTKLIGGVAQGSKDHNGGKDASEKIDKGDYVCIQMHRRCEPVVTAEHHNTAPGNAEREKDLTCRFPPHLEVCKLVPSASVRHQEVVDTVGSSGKGY